MEYPPENWLPLSGIQNFVFCRRQWALIHIENQWDDNVLTIDGRIFHRRVDDPAFTETREGVIIARSVPVASPTLGLSGICDVVEFIPSSDGVSLPARQGFYRPVPVEYKRGRPKHDPCDEAHLCAQAICLEEMLSTTIPIGYLFYAQTRRRLEIALGDELRELVRSACEEMHRYYERGYTPRVRPSKACRSCSLQEICLPALQGRQETSASHYIRQHLEGM